MNKNDMHFKDADKKAVQSIAAVFGIDPELTDFTREDLLKLASVVDKHLVIN